MKQDLIEGWKDLDKPLELPESVTRLRKKGKLKVIIHYEDTSYKEFYVKLKNDYYITIKKKKYVLLPNAIERGKQPCIHYYFNNPLPITFKYQHSSVTPEKLWGKTRFGKLPEEIQELLAEVSLDSSAIHSAMDSSWISSMYARKGITTKAIIIILAFILIVILILLQVTGTVDVIGFISGTAEGG